MMSYLWTPEEDAILMKGCAAGWSRERIANALAQAGSARTAGSVKHRARMLKLSISRPPERAWSQTEDHILKAAVEAGFSMSVLSKSLTDAGYSRSPSACVKRAIRIGVRVDRDDPEPATQTTSDHFAEAMRKAHPEREGLKRSLYDKSVPARISGDPNLSITGSQF